VHLAAPAVAGPFPGPSASGFYVALLAAGVALTAGSRLVAAVGVRAGSRQSKAAEPPVSVLRLPKR
jgi:acyl dehydratase